MRWHLDTYVTRPDGATRRIRRKRIPTREQAEAWERMRLIEAFAGRAASASAPYTIPMTEDERAIGEAMASWTAVSSSEENRTAAGFSRATPT